MIQAPRGKKGGRAVRVYDPAVGHKVYVGTRYSLKEARALERDKASEFALRRTGFAVSTVAAWAEEWLRRYPRPQESTRRYNRQMAKQLVKRYGNRRHVASETAYSVSADLGHISMPRFAA